MVERRLKTVRRLFHPLLVEMCAMLENSATLIVPAPRQEVCDAYLRRRQFFGARSAEIFEGICLFLIGFLNKMARAAGNVFRYMPFSDRIS